MYRPAAVAMRPFPFFSFFPFFLTALALLSLSLPLAAANLVNTRVVYVIDATGDVARVQAQVRLRNDGTAPVSTVHILAPPGSGHVTVSEGEKLTRGGMIGVTAVPGEGAEYTARLSAPLGVGSGAEVTIVIAYELFDAIAPSPPTLREGEPHFVALTCGAHFLSPYATEASSTLVKMARAPPDGAVLRAPEPVDVDGKLLKLGPFTALPPRSEGEVEVRFQNDRGMLVAREYERQMYVSHWGNVAMREEYRVENAAAKHVGRWSRVDYSMGEASRFATKTAIGDVWANLPRTASNVVYQDLVGNITTSRMRVPNAKFRPVQLSFRFPLLGG